MNPQDPGENDDHDQIDPDETYGKGMVVCQHCQGLYEELYTSPTLQGNDCATFAWCDARGDWRMYGAYGSAVTDCSIYRVVKPLACLTDPTLDYVFCDRCVRTWIDDQTIELESCYGTWFNPASYRPPSHTSS